MNPPHHRLVVCRDNLDNPVGFVHVKDLLSQVASDCEVDIASVLHEPQLIPESAPALRILEQFKSTNQHLAVVVDEYGGTAGIVTLHDIWK